MAGAVAIEAERLCTKIMWLRTALASHCTSWGVCKLGGEGVLLSMNTNNKTDKNEIL
jgi:hypothetical protein